jgi:hypothetical protein
LALLMLKPPTPPIFFSLVFFELHARRAGNNRRTNTNHINVMFAHNLNTQSAARKPTLGQSRLAAAAAAALGAEQQAASVAGMAQCGKHKF